MATHRIAGLMPVKMEALREYYKFDPKKHMTVAQAAAYFKVEQNYLLKMLRDKKATPKPIKFYGTRGLAYYFTKRDIEQLATNNEFWYDMLTPESYRRQEYDTRSQGQKGSRRPSRLVAASSVVRPRVSTNTEDLPDEVKRYRTYRTLLGDGATPDEAVRLIKSGLFDT